MKVRDKVIVVTGGGNGIGRELVLNLLQRGADVAAVDLNAPALAETAKLCGRSQGKLSIHTVNITQRETVAALPEQVIARHGAVDALINNAGIIQPFVRVNDLDYAAIERVMNVNFYGVLYMTKAFLPHLLARPEAHIANISSMGGFLPVPGQTVYGAAKAAVKLFTEGLQAELLQTKVHVTAVFPGAIGTNIAANSGVEINLKSVGRMQNLLKPMPPARAAEMIIDGIEQNRERVFVGSDSVFLDRFYRLSPGRAVRLIAKQMEALLTK